MVKRDKKGSSTDFDKSQLLIMLSSLIILILITSIIKIKQVPGPEPHQYSPPTANSFEECLEKGGKLVKSKDKYQTDHCLLDEWEYSRTPSKPTDINYTFQLEDNQFITAYNKTDPLTFTLDIPKNCNIVGVNDPLNKEIECNIFGQTITIRPTEGGRSGPQESAIITSNKVSYGGFEWDRTLYRFSDQTAFATYSLTHPQTNDYYLMSIHYPSYSDESAIFVDRIFSTMKFGEIVNRVVAD